VANPWAAIVGTRIQGRDQVVQAVIDGLQAAGRHVAGFLHRSRERAGNVEGYDVVDVESGESWPMARYSRDPQVCDWEFDEMAFTRVRARLAEHTSHVVLFELGPLEGKEKGHWQAVMEVLEGPPRLLLLCIRPKALAPIALELPDPVADLELPAQQKEIDAFVEEIVGFTPPAASIS
jgi:nucleoside-triphosphatase THEP1